MEDDAAFDFLKKLEQDFSITDNFWSAASRKVSVRDLLDLVHNVILIECIFGSGKPRGVGILGKGEYMGYWESKGGSVYEQQGAEVDGSWHSKEGSE
jgi:hypothetical protein